MVDKYSAPAFSMSSPLKKDKHKIKQSPGPGSYESVSYLNTSKVSSIKQTD